MLPNTSPTAIIDASSPAVTSRKSPSSFRLSFVVKLSPVCVAAISAMQPYAETSSDAQPLVAESSATPSRALRRRSDSIASP